VLTAGMVGRNSGALETLPDKEGLLPDYRIENSLLVMDGREREFDPNKVNNIVDKIAD
jgi:hypothetical protein